MKFTLWYLAVGLEVWMGVFAILMGLFILMSIVSLPAEYRASSGVLLVVLGAVLVGDAVRRELKVRVMKRMENFGSPLDTPTQAG